MKYEIGRKILVTASVPYFETDKPATFFELTIIAKRTDVQGEYNHAKLYTGYLAIDSQGKEYGWGWNRYPETATNGPCWQRHISNEVWHKMSKKEKEEATNPESYIVRDVTDFQTPKTPDFLKQYPHIKYCEDHQTLYYEWDSCFLCEHKCSRTPEERRVVLVPIKRQYNGWFD